MAQHVDFLIIGQGLAGSALAWELTRRGKSVMVLDEPLKNRASRIAAGLCNPITGKMMAKTWKAETIFPFIAEFYATAGRALGQKFLSDVPVYRPFASEDERNLWSRESNVSRVANFIREIHATPVYTDELRNPFGGVEIAGACCLDTQRWLDAVRKFLAEKNACQESYFDENELVTDGDTLRYRNLDAGKIIFCNGLAALDSRWFKWLPLIPLKGETLQVRIQAPLKRIYTRGVYLVPTSDTGIYKAGATYEHSPFSSGPSIAAREDLHKKLSDLIVMPFEVIHQDWGIRPTTPDRRPLLGAHPSKKNIILLNGLGTKGVSLAPYLANLLADWMEGAGDLLPEINIYRFKSLYSE